MRSLDLGPPFCHLTLALHLCLCANTAKDQADTEPLHTGETVAEGDDREDHREHLPGDSHSDEDEGAEFRERVDCQCQLSSSQYDVRGGGITDKDLTETATDGKAENIHGDLRVQLNKGERIRQLGTPRVEDEIGQRQTGREGVQRGHHLRPTHDATGSAREDVILDGVCEAVEKEIDAQQEHAPHDILLGIAAAGLARGLGGSRVQGEDGNAGSDKGHDSVLVDWIFPAEEGHVQEHDGEEFAGFGEDVGDVVNVAETGVAEGRGEGLSDRD